MFIKQTTLLRWVSILKILTILISQHKFQLWTKRTTSRLSIPTSLNIWHFWSNRDTYCTRFSWAPTVPTDKPRTFWAASSTMTTTDELHKSKNPSHTMNSSVSFITHQFEPSPSNQSSSHTAAQPFLPYGRASPFAPSAPSAPSSSIHIYATIGLHPTSSLTTTFYFVTYCHHSNYSHFFFQFNPPFRTSLSASNFDICRWHAFIPSNSLYYCTPDHPGPSLLKHQTLIAYSISKLSLPPLTYRTLRTKTNLSPIPSQCSHPTTATTTTTTKSFFLRSLKAWSYGQSHTSSNLPSPLHMSFD